MSGIQLPLPTSVFSVYIWEVTRPLSKHLPFPSFRVRSTPRKILEEAGQN